jgi:hypothetical protein
MDDIATFEEVAEYSHSRQSLRDAKHWPFLGHVT